MEKDNRHPRNDENIVKRKRGRPRKIKIEEPKDLNTEIKHPRNDIHTEKIDMSNVRISKFMGYCNGNKCEGMITSNDLEDGKKFIYVCPKCGKRFRENELIKVKENSDRPKSKKEFLEQVIVVDDECVVHDYHSHIAEEIVVTDDWQE